MEKMMHRPTSLHTLVTLVFALAAAHAADHCDSGISAVRRGGAAGGVRPTVGTADMVRIPGGEFWMGSDHADMEDARPVHRVYVDAFSMDRTEVTNDQFAAFVAATGY